MIVSRQHVHCCHAQVWLVTNLTGVSAGSDHEGEYHHGTPTLYLLMCTAYDIRVPGLSGFLAVAFVVPADVKALNGTK
jgi:hypothetical protein